MRYESKVGHHFQSHYAHNILKYCSRHKHPSMAVKSIKLLGGKYLFYTEDRNTIGRSTGQWENFNYMLYKKYLNSILVILIYLKKSSFLVHKMVSSYLLKKQFCSFQHGKLNIYKLLWYFCPTCFLLQVLDLYKDFARDW